MFRNIPMFHSAKLVIQNFYKYKRKPSWWNVQTLCQVRCTATIAVENGEQLRILFFGTDNFSLPSLEALHRWKSQYTTQCEQSLGVVTSFKNPANCVRLYADKAGLPLYRWPVESDIVRHYDLGVVVSFGHLIPEKVINTFQLGMINVHASLLPRWRGAAPIMYAIMHGDQSTGVSIMKIKPKHFDIGDILAQEKVAIKENIFMPELHSELAQLGANLLVGVLSDYPRSFENVRQQIDDEATYAPKISSALTEVNWIKHTADQLYCLHRALYGFKHLSTRFQGKSVQLVEVRLRVGSDLKTSNVPGVIVHNRERNCLIVRCANNTEIEICQLRMEGKKVMHASDFNNGFLKKMKTFVVKFECYKNNAV